MMNRLQLRHILCPMDLSPMSMNALHWANSMAQSGGSWPVQTHCLCCRSRAGLGQRYQTSGVAGS
jgi:hypothetical protein